MRQNIYDEEGFFANYAGMARSVGGLDAAGEWPAFRALLPELRGKRVLDIGCGYGWHCRYVREQGARSAVGIDLSEKMLARARAATDDPSIVYRRMAIEDMDFRPGEFDLAVSSLAFHYVERIDAAFGAVHNLLTDGGSFVLSVEHPIFTSRSAQDWDYGPDGEKRHWPVDDYQDEGPRNARFLDHDVVKYHRTLAAYVNTLIGSGFRIAGIAEPQPPEAMLEMPGMRDELRRPMFLLLAAVKA